MEQETRDTLHLIVGMIEELGKKVDNLDKKVNDLDKRMDRLEAEVKDIKEQQEKTNDKLDAVISMYGDHEVFIRQLKMKKII